jgi:cyclophilin family peptidyl-prolyl cis-trans isomerase
MLFFPARSARFISHDQCCATALLRCGRRAAFLAAASWLAVLFVAPAAVRAVPPAIRPVADQTVYYGKSLVVPVAADGVGPIQYSVKSSQRGTLARVKMGDPWLKIVVDYPGDGGSADPFGGELIFQLFRDMTPVTVGYIAGFAQEGYYDGLTFHRIINLTGEPDGFIAQGGDPAGNGTGGPGFTFENEFRLPLMFVGAGQLAMANSGYSGYSGTNGSQIFVTSGTLRHLDFAHTIFGQLVRGFDVLEKLMAVPTTGGTPTATVTMTTVELVENDTDAVLLLSASSKQEAPATVTVTATDANGETSEATFLLTAQVDSVNSPPILVQPANVVAATGRSASYPLIGKDLEFDFLSPAIDGFFERPAGTTSSMTRNIVTIIPSTGASPDGKVITGNSIEQRTAVLRSSAKDLTRAYVGLGESKLLGFDSELSAKAGVAFVGLVVAQFRDFDRNSNPATDFTAKINWGDSSAVEAVPPPLVSSKKPSTKVYDVPGSHTYANPGIYTVETLVEGNNGARAVIRNRVNVSDGPLAATGRRLTAARGRLVNRLLASFGDTDLKTKPSDYTATVEWGDGARSAATIRRGRGGFNLFGSHTYADNQTYAAAVRVAKNGAADTAEAWVDVESTGLNVPEHQPPFSQAKVAGFLEQATPSDPFRLALELINSGNKTANAGTLEFYLSDDDVFDAGDSRITMDDGGGHPRETIWYGPVLQAGASVTGVFPNDAGSGVWNAPPGKGFNGRHVIMKVNQKDPLGDLMPFDVTAVTGKITANEPGNPSPHLATAKNPTDQDPFTVTLDFLRSVTGLGSSDFTVTNGALVGVPTDLGNGQYSVEINPANNGNVTVAVAAQAVVDGDGLYSNSESLVVKFDTVAPTPVLSGPASTSDDPFTVDVDFGEAVTGFEVGDLVVSNGTATTVAPIGAANSQFRVTVDPAADGAVTVDIAAGAAEDSAGNSSLAATQFSTTFTAAP